MSTKVNLSKRNVEPREMLPEPRQLKRARSAKETGEKSITSGVTEKAPLITQRQKLFHGKPTVSGSPNGMGVTIDKGILITDDGDHDPRRVSKDAW